MTLELLNKICEQNNIPSDVRLTSNSGWECDATEMDGIFYKRNENTLEFTQEVSINDMVKYSKQGWDCLYSEGYADDEIFSQKCYECKHRMCDTWSAESPCRNTVWNDYWHCPHFEPMRKE